MKRLDTLVLGICIFLCITSGQAFAGEVLSGNAKAMLQEDLKLYDFYKTNSYSLELCSEKCPGKRSAIDNASAALVSLLDNAISSVRGRQHERVNFAEHDAMLKEKVALQFAGCSPCTDVVQRVNTYSAEGLPESVARVALLHSERYAQNPEFEFEDGLTRSVAYRWSAHGKSRKCLLNIPETWSKDVAGSTPRTQVFRSALGNGIPFFSITYMPVNRMPTEDAAHKFLLKRVAQSALEREYGSVEVLAQGVHMLGSAKSIWVIFNADGKFDRGPGYFYNWYILFDGTLLTFHSGVSDNASEIHVEHEELFRKYYQTLREIAQSSVIR